MNQVEQLAIHPEPDYRLEMPPSRRVIRKAALTPLIAIPLKPVTMYTDLVITVTLLLYLFIGCATIDNIKCSLSHLPMISHILKYHMYDRIFVLEITFNSYFVFFGNVRAFYARFYGVFDKNVSDLLYWLGIFAAVSIPMVGLIDEDLNNPIHSTFAVIFFVCSALYVVFFTSQLKSLGPDVLTPSEINSVKNLQTYRSLIAIVMVLGLSSAALNGSHGPTPYFEWIGTLLLLNSFTLMAQLDNQVEVVMPEKELKN